MTRVLHLRALHLRAHGDADGAVLIEAITGVAMLAVLSATLMTFHSAAVGAAARAEQRATATSLAREDLEERVAIRAGDATTTTLGQLSIETATMETDGPRCWGSVSELGGVTVHVKEAGVVLGAPFGPRARTVVPAGVLAAPATILLRGPDVVESASGAAGLLEASVTAVGGAPRSLPLVDGCISANALAPGRHEFLAVVDEDALLVDAAHRSAHESPLVLTVLESPVRRTWDLSVATVLSVDVETYDARLPDTVGSGALRWSLRGDDLRVMRELGETRPVRSGPAVAVVSACLNPEAAASSTMLDLPAGGMVSVAVPLATITIQGVAAWPGATLFLSRLTECFDGSGARPSLAWDGGLHDGMRIALPHGEWEGRLQTATGTRITAPVRFPAGDTGTTVGLS